MGWSWVGWGRHGRCVGGQPHRPGWQAGKVHFVANRAGTLLPTCVCVWGGRGGGVTGVCPCEGGRVGTVGSGRHVARLQHSQSLMAQGCRSVPTKGCVPSDTAARTGIHSPALGSCHHTTPNVVILDVLLPPSTASSLVAPSPGIPRQPSPQQCELRPARAPAARLPPPGPPPPSPGARAGPPCARLPGRPAASCRTASEACCPPAASQRGSMARGGEGGEGDQAATVRACMGRGQGFRKSVPRPGLRARVTVRCRP